MESQKKIAPAFLVVHQPERPFLKPSPLLALGSLFGFLHPGSVQAMGNKLAKLRSKKQSLPLPEIVTIKLETKAEYIYR